MARTGLTAATTLSAPALLLADSLALLPTLSSVAQEQYRLLLDFGIGASVGRSEYVSQTADVNRTLGFVGLARLKVAIGDVFSLGVETGWQHILEQRTSSARVVLPNLSRTGDTTLTTSIRGWLDGIPIMIVLSGEVYNISIQAGLGYYSIISRAELFESTVTSIGFDWAGSLSLGYVFSIASNLSLMVEARAVRLIDSQRSLLSLQTRLILPILHF
jgi:hypothetical protein